MGILENAEREVICPANMEERCQVYIDIELAGLSVSFLLIDSLPSEMDHEILMPVPLFNFEPNSIFFPS